MEDNDVTLIAAREMTVGARRFHSGATVAIVSSTIPLDRLGNAIVNGLVVPAPETPDVDLDTNDGA